MTKGNRIKEKRESLGLAQTDVANQINVSKQTLYKYENDIITNIPSDKVELLARVLHVTPEYIMGWESETHSTLTSDNANLIAKITFDKDMIACVRKLYSLDESKRNQAYSYINFLASDNM